MSIRDLFLVAVSKLNMLMANKVKKLISLDNILGVSHYRVTSGASFSYYFLFFDSKFTQVIN